MATSNQGNYLLRQDDDNSYAILEWLGCCRANTVYKSEAKMNKNSIMLKKKPLKSIANKLDCSFTKRSKQNCNKSERNHNTQRVQLMKPSSRITETSNIYLNTTHSKIASTKDEKNIKNCKIRFSYIHPKNTIYNGSQKQNNNPSKVINKAEKGVSSLDTHPSQNEYNQSQRKNTQNTTALPLLTNKKSAQSVQKPAKFILNKPYSRQDLFGLKMRQVQSIKEPQDNSDHQSIVLDKSDHALFDLLLSIREIQKQSNTQ